MKLLTLFAIVLLSSCRARAESPNSSDTKDVVERMKCTRADGQNLKEDYWEVSLSGSNIKFDGYSERHSGLYARSEYALSSNKKPAYILHLFFTAFYWNGSSLLKETSNKIITKCLGSKPNMFVSPPLKSSK